VFGRFVPEAVSENGKDEFDTAVVDLAPKIYERRLAALGAQRDALIAKRAAESDSRVRQDLDIRLFEVAQALGHWVRRIGLAEVRQLPGRFLLAAVAHEAADFFQPRLGGTPNRLLPLRRNFACGGGGGWRAGRRSARRRVARKRLRSRYGAIHASHWAAARARHATLSTRSGRRVEIARMRENNAICRPRPRLYTHMNIGAPGRSRRVSVRNPRRGSGR